MRVIRHPTNASFKAPEFGSNEYFINTKILVIKTDTIFRQVLLIRRLITEEKEKEEVVADKA